MSNPAFSEDADYTELSAKRKREWDRRFDKQDIRHSGEMQRDQSPRMLQPPERLGDAAIDVADTPPVVEFAIVQGLEPEYMDEGHHWGGWGDVRRGPEGRFYFALGNHAARGANAHIVQYDPESQTQDTVLSSRELVGWGTEEYGDSKIHGYPDVGPDGEMWVTTFETLPWDSNTAIPDDLWEEGYRGSWLLRLNVHTGEAENVGVPVVGETWPYSTYDWERDRLFAVNRNRAGNAFLAYDTEKRAVRYAGAPKDGIALGELLLDRETGDLYATSHPEGEGSAQDPDPAVDYQFVRYDPEKNAFTRLDAYVPENSRGISGGLRTHTHRKDADGKFWCCDYTGNLFSFDPAREQTEFAGVNWVTSGHGGPGSGRYVPNLCLSPGGRYLYYELYSAYKPNEQGASANGTPVVQYDVERDRKTVIAFLHDYYLEEYGYSPNGTYGCALDENGESLFLYDNGRFTSPEHGGRYGRPAIFQVHIPESERQE